MSNLFSKHLPNSIQLFLTVVSFLISFSVFSFPIDLQKDWKAKEGIHKDSVPDETWQSFEKTTIRFSKIKPKEGNVQSYTFYKEVSFPEMDYSSIQDSVSILIPNIMNMYEFYFDGNLLSSRGKIENGKIIRYGYRRNIIVVIPQKLLSAGNHKIHIIASSAANEDIELTGNASMTADFHSKHIEAVSERMPLMIIFMYIFVGFYHLLLFLKRTQEKYNLFFGLFCLDIFCYLFLRTEVSYSLNLDPFLVTRIEYMFLFLLSPLALVFFDNFFENKVTRFSQAFLGLCGLMGFTVLFMPRYIASKILLGWQILALVSFIYFIIIIIRAIKNRHQDAKRLLLAFGIFIFAAIYDVVGATNLIPGIVNKEFMKYGFFTFIIGIAFVLANRFLRLHKQVEDLNSNLEQKVEQRTKELQNSLDEIRFLKFQQDGDYFLTTLLINPLMTNKTKSDNITVEYYVKQKKNFMFKNKTYEIGGDICISDMIILRDKKYVAFINGDAMGKSIQGAGGALVLGVIFKSILERTKSYGKQLNIYPERWLKNCFSELHDVFVSFDGSMLVSVVMGLVDEATGMLYFINAEHPFTILYRDGKADFLETKLMHHKIGMQGLEGSVRVQTFQMEPQDIIIIGSDGRDDIVISNDGHGNRQINEDENLFLKKVEQGDADLKRVTELLLKEGELSDDYTLLKINYTAKHFSNITQEYQKLFEQAEQLSADQGEKIKELYKKALKYNENADVLRKLSEMCFKEKSWIEFIHFAERLVKIRPSESLYYYRLSYAFLQVEDYHQAADYGESLKLREPENVENLMNLIEVYRRMNRMERIQELIHKGLYYQPDNRQLLEQKALVTGF